jgi:hypothetical protein
MLAVCGVRPCGGLSVDVDAALDVLCAHNCVTRTFWPRRMEVTRSIVVAHAIVTRLPGLVHASDASTNPAHVSPLVGLALEQSAVRGIDACRAWVRAPFGSV